jgi:hypothetical protein
MADFTAFVFELRPPGALNALFLARAAQHSIQNLYCSKHYTMLLA